MSQFILMHSYALHHYQSSETLQGIIYYCLLSHSFLVNKDIQNLTTDIEESVL